MTTEIQKAQLRGYAKGYNRGYATGISKAWPSHAPPSPPEENVRELMEAAKRLRDAADSVISVIEPDEPILRELDSAITPLDNALTQISEWLKRLPPPQCDST